MVRSKIFTIISITLFVLSLMVSGQALAVCIEPVMSDYQSYPIFQTNAVEPNIVFLLDNGAQMKYAVTNADYDSGVIYNIPVPVSGNSNEAVFNAGNATGFYNKW